MFMLLDLVLLLKPTNQNPNGITQTLEPLEQMYGFECRRGIRWSTRG